MTSIVAAVATLHEMERTLVKTRRVVRNNAAYPGVDDLAAALLECVWLTLAHLGAPQGTGKVA